jgi:hypothetical protein
VIYLVGTLLIGVSVLCGYITDHKDFEAVITNSASWLALFSFLLVLYLTDTLWRFKFEERRKNEVEHYAGTLEGYCKEFRTLVDDYSNSLASVDERLPYFRGEIDHLNEVLFSTERRVLFRIRFLIWVYDQRKSKRNLAAVVGEMNRLHARIKAWERDNA